MCSPMLGLCWRIRRLRFVVIHRLLATTLTAVATPAGNMTYKEAAVVLECKLSEVTTVSPDDFLNEDDKKFVVDAHAETGEYHKMIFSEITNVWIRK